MRRSGVADAHAASRLAEIDAIHAAPRHDAFVTGHRFDEPDLELCIEFEP